jgi:hypothetical protein
MSSSVTMYSSVSERSACSDENRTDASVISVPCATSPVRGAQRRCGSAEGNEVRVAAYFHRLRRADLDAVVAFPAQFGTAVERLHFFFIENHEVVGANVLAGSFVQCFTPVAFIRNYITWH